jgi:hypothetical protein
MLGVMHVLIRRSFAAAFEWRRLTHLVVVMGGMTVVGTVVMPVAGVAWLLLRGLVFLAIPGVLLATGFLHASELAAARRFLARLRGPDVRESPIP